MTCISCGRTIGDADARFCPYCGTLQNQGTSALFRTAPVAKWWRLLLPVLALIGSFSPWVRVVGPTRNTMAQWDAYGLTLISWIWLVWDLAAVILAITWASIRSGWLRALWYLFGTVSFGVSASGFIFVRVASHVSSLLGAPSPLKLDYGLYVFTLITGVWTLTAWLAWKDKLAA